MGRITIFSRKMFGCDAAVKSPANDPGSLCVQTWGEQKEAEIGRCPAYTLVYATGLRVRSSARRSGARLRTYSCRRRRLGGREVCRYVYRGWGEQKTPCIYRGFLLQNRARNPSTRSQKSFARSGPHTGYREGKGRKHRDPLGCPESRPNTGRDFAPPRGAGLSRTIRVRSREQEQKTHPKKTGVGFLFCARNRT